MAEKIRDVSQLFGYCEIVTNPDQVGFFDDEYKLSTVYQKITNKKMKCVSIHEKPDIWKAFTQLFGGKIYALGDY